MVLIHNNIEMPDDGSDPFVNYKLERAKYVNAHTSIISEYNDGFVIAIDNKWGNGKTTFVKM